MREEQTKRRQRRIAEAKALLGGVCVVCGTTENLDFDHVDPSTKIFNVARQAGDVSEKRFWAEVSKCQLLCRPHHIDKCKMDGSRTTGQLHPNSKLKESDVPKIRELYSLGHTQTALARKFGVSQSTVWKVVTGKGWTHVPRREES